MWLVSSQRRASQVSPGKRPGNVGVMLPPVKEALEGEGEAEAPSESPPTPWPWPSDLQHRTLRTA